MTIGWEVLNEETLLHRPPWVRVVAETLQLEDGVTVIDDFYRVDIPDFAVIFALTTENRVALVQQYRHALREQSMELPAGHIPPEDTPLDTARRELREETGLEAPNWQKLGTWIVDPNRGCGRGHAYLATGAFIAGPRSDVDLQRQTTHLFSISELRDFYLSGNCTVMSTVATIGMALTHLTLQGLI